MFGSPRAFLRRPFWGRASLLSALLLIMGATSGCSRLPSATGAAAQSSRVYRVGFLARSTALPSSRQSFLDALAELGYVPGRTIIVDFRNGGQDERTA